MSRRIHIVVDDQEGQAFRAQAAAEGRSVSEWLRAAARERLRQSRPDSLRTAEDLEAFFARCDADEDQRSREPEWAEHVAVIGQSRSEGLPPP